MLRQLVSIVSAVLPVLSKFKLQLEAESQSLYGFSTMDNDIAKVVTSSVLLYLEHSIISSYAFKIPYKNKY